MTFEKTYQKNFRNPSSHLALYLAILFFTFKYQAKAPGHGSIGVNCKLNGKCRMQNNVGQNKDTTCSGCKSCTFKGCCHKIYTNPLIHCPIEGGWRSKDYVGTLHVVGFLPAVKRGHLKKRGTRKILFSLYVNILKRLGKYFFLNQ